MKNASSPGRQGDGRNPIPPCPLFALSLKQPWAALLVHGRKTVEVRNWPTARRGRILIHAARVPDERSEAWQHVPDDLRAAAQMVGGVVGAGDLVGLRTYRTLEAFTGDRAEHLNDPIWFTGEVLFGFQFTNLTPLPFRPLPGWMRFFEVPEEKA